MNGLQNADFHGKQLADKAQESPFEALMVAHCSTKQWLIHIIIFIGQGP